MASASTAVPSDPIEQSLRLALTMQLEEIGVAKAQEFCDELVPNNLSAIDIQISLDQLFARQLWEQEVRMRTDEKLAVSLGRKDYGIMTDAGFEKQNSDFNTWKATSLKDGTTKPDELFDCGVCMERLDRAKHQFHQLPCRHAFCLRCYRTYVQMSVELGNLEIFCPDRECKTVLDVQRIFVIMAGCGPVFNVLQRLILSQDLRKSTLYCANRECSEPFVVANRADLDSRKTRLFTCPWCATATCGQCKRVGHGDGPCPTDVDELDRMMREAQIAEGWKECPKCKHVIAKSEDTCNFLRCLCGCAFCYNCSTPYRSTRPTAANVHGTPGCGCGLFEVPPEVE